MHDRRLALASHPETGRLGKRAIVEEEGHGCRRSGRRACATRRRRGAAGRARAGRSSTTSSCSRAAFVAANRQRARAGRQIEAQAGVEGGDGLHDDRELIVADADHQQAVAGAVTLHRQEIGAGRQQRETRRADDSARAPPRPTGAPARSIRIAQASAPRQPAMRRQIEDRDAARRDAAAARPSARRSRVTGSAACIVQTIDTASIDGARERQRGRGDQRVRPDRDDGRCR